MQSESEHRSNSIRHSLVMSSYTIVLMLAFSIYMTMYLIRIKTNLGDPCYLADWLQGDLPRTSYPSQAKCFIFAHEALKKIEELRKIYTDKSFSLEETF